MFHVVLQACLRQFHMVDVMRGMIEGEKQQASRASAAEYGKRLHFRRKPAVEKAVRNWNGQQTGEVLGHLHNAVLETRMKPGMQESIARQALLAVALRSHKLSRQ